VYLCVYVCLLYFCIIFVLFMCSFGTLLLLVGFLTCKTVAHIYYTVLAETLNPARSKSMGWWSKSFNTALLAHNWRHTSYDTEWHLLTCGFSGSWCRRRDTVHQSRWNMGKIMNCCHATFHFDRSLGIVIVALKIMKILYFCHILTIASCDPYNCLIL